MFKQVTSKKMYDNFKDTKFICSTNTTEQNNNLISQN